MAQVPILPHGSSSLLSSLSETFAFHSSPETFITSRILACRASNPLLAESRTPIRAKILNRNVAVVSSYKHVTQVLCDDAIATSLTASRAYNKMMAPFFPPPNLLLSDPPAHHQMKEAWRDRMTSLVQDIEPLAAATTSKYFRSIPSGSSVNLYECMKSLSWHLVLGIFLCDPKNQEHGSQVGEKVESLQEGLLRGQFSLFPVSINNMLWQSLRSKGIAAREKLQALLRKRVEQEPQGCPFASTTDDERNDIASHMLLFTSSLAVKAMASLLTAVMLNVFIPHASEAVESTALASKITALTCEEDQNALIRSIILETERLSPPVVGIMRRTTADIILPSGIEDVHDTLIPEDWDAWLYFVGAARDTNVFGDTADVFVPDRYYHSDDQAPTGFAYGTGAKSCLGEHLIKVILMSVVKVCLGIQTESQTTRMKPMNFVCESKVLPVGVQGWLGWKKDVKPEDWARDVKQLPTQRPLKPVVVTVEHCLQR